MRPVEEQTGQLVRVVLAGDQPLWTKNLAGKIGVIVRNERVGFNRVLEVVIDGTVYRLHPLDLEYM